MEEGEHDSTETEVREAEQEEEQAADKTAGVRRPRTKKKIYEALLSLGEVWSREQGSDIERKQWSADFQREAFEEMVWATKIWEGLTEEPSVEFAEETYLTNNLAKGSGEVIKEELARHREIFKEAGRWHQGNRRNPRRDWWSWGTRRNWWKRSGWMLRLELGSRYVFFCRSVQGGDGNYGDWMRRGLSSYSWCCMASGERRRPGGSRFVMLWWPRDSHNVRMTLLSFCFRTNKRIKHRG
eukprot:c19231_g1_i3.p1 GENE.c19231_g1_i3~~c19231_g1_i3.p1  ORF type:complete len:270 (+),score=7.55 c19231_g1_i3:93-812(+)